MNPLTNVRNLNKINERELASGSAGDDRRSWHSKYKDSAWIFVGGLPYELSEGDVVCVFSQYGEIVNVNLIRDKKTGKSRGFCFICFDDQRSTVLAVDNFNGTKVLNRILRVDHVEQYRVPKDREDVDDETRRLWMEGCAPETQFVKPEEPPIEAAAPGSSKMAAVVVDRREELVDVKSERMEKSDRRPEKLDKSDYRGRWDQSEKRSTKDEDGRRGDRDRRRDNKRDKDSRERNRGDRRRSASRSSTSSDSRDRRRARRTDDDAKKRKADDDEATGWEAST